MNHLGKVWYKAHHLGSPKTGRAPHTLRKKTRVANSAGVSPPQGSPDRRQDPGETAAVACAGGGGSQDFLPYAQVLLAHLALQTLVLVIDGSVVGRGCVALMIHVVYKGRALPLAWRVRQGPKGHFPEDLHIAVVELMREVIPEGAKVVFLGAGELDGTALQATLNKAGRYY